MDRGRTSSREGGHERGQHSGKKRLSPTYLLAFEIRRLHRQEIRLWKKLRLRQSLGRASHWKALRNMIQTIAGQASVSQPPLDELVDALAAIFLGNQFFPGRLAVLTETNWTLDAARPFEG